MNKRHIKNIVKQSIAKNLRHKSTTKAMVGYSIDNGKFNFQMGIVGEDLLTFLQGNAKVVGPQTFLINGRDHSLIYMGMLDSYLKANGDSARNSDGFAEEVTAARAMVDDAKSKGIDFVITEV